MKNKFLVCIAFLVVVAINACAREYPAAPAYYPHPSGHFPITASYALYHPYMTDQQMKWVKEAGFNNITKVLSYEDSDSLIRLASKHGISVLVANFDMRDTLKTRQGVERYKDNPTVWGFTAYDEPNASKFDYLAVLENKMLRYAPQKTRFFNLLPAVEGTPWLGTKDYRTYVEEFVRTVNPPFISLDIYPVNIDRKTNKRFVAPMLYKTMEVIRDVANESDRPIWCYILSNQHGNYPKPTKEYIRFSVFTALAYGAQGLIYYTYLLPDFDQGKGEYSNAPIDLKGNRTDVWYMVRDINNEVRNLEKVFLGATVLDVSQSGASIPESTKRLTTLPAPFGIIESDGMGVTVSHLRNGSDEYLLLVNRDINRKQKVYLSRRRPVIRIYGDGKEKLDKGNSLTLTPGGYALFKIP